VTLLNKLGFLTLGSIIKSPIQCDFSQTL